MKFGYMRVYTSLVNVMYLSGTHHKYDKFKYFSLKRYTHTKKFIIKQNFTIS